jgi:aspartyl-tRNA(Asn)/glutamyl-tRNA(Gln) amidotransferase subunit A
MSSDYILTQIHPSLTHLNQATENMLSATETADKVRRGQLSATQSVSDAFDRIERMNPELNAFVQTNREMADRAATLIDEMVAKGEDPGPLAGVPIGVKDMEACIGFRITQGSWFLRDQPIETHDSRHVARLRSAGAIPIGITAASEFGMDSATSTKLWGVTRNPWNVEKTPGGSSGGSAAAVASGMVPLATGTDAGGSIREPAAFTGLVGLKPSHGRIPKMNGFSNWSVHGILARNSADAARHLDVASGPDDGDRQSLPKACFSFEQATETLKVDGLKAVWSRDYGYAVVEDEVAEIAEAAARKLMAAANLYLSDARFSCINIYPHWGAIFGSTLEEDFIRSGYLPDGFDHFSPCVQRVIERIRRRKETIDVKESWAQVHALEQQVASFFQDYDLLFSPATACRPYEADGSPPMVIEGKDSSQGGAEPFGMLANACWNPSISIPAGITSDGLPVGLQIVARRHRDDILLRLARLAEAIMPWPGPEYSGT